MIFRILFWVMLFCIFSFTIGQFIPIYFNSQDLRTSYYPILLIITLSTIPVLLFRRIYNPQKNNWISSTLYTFLVALLAVVVFGFITLGKFMVVPVNAGTYYINKSDLTVKIVSKYDDLGAFGGGTSPDDYETVVSRPITTFLKIETKIDTTKINKAEWIKPSSYKP